MSNKLKGMHIKYRTYYFFDGRINIKNLPPNKIKIVKQSYRNILVYQIRYVTVKKSELSNKS